MPDITMCKSVDCPIKLTCYRFMAKPTPGWQSYAAFAYDETRKKCDDFMPIWNKSDVEVAQDG